MTDHDPPGIIQGIDFSGLTAHTPRDLDHIPGLHHRIGCLTDFSFTVSVDWAPCPGCAVCLAGQHTDGADT